MIETNDMNGIYSVQNSGVGGVSAKNDIEQSLSQANGPVNDGETFAHALDYVDQDYYGYADPKKDEFGFGDMIDMVNPLQHIPLVGSLYRGITGDEIKPISQIIGGAVFGGGIGAASGLINVVVERETGEGIAGNMMNFIAGSGKNNAGGYSDFEYSGSDHPEIQLNRALEDMEYGNRGAYEELPPTVLGFTDLGYGKREVYTQYEAADGRTAGTMVRSRTEVAAPDNASREPISRVEFAPFFGLNLPVYD